MTIHINAIELIILLFCLDRVLFIRNRYRPAIEWDGRRHGYKNSWSLWIYWKRINEDKWYRYKRIVTFRNFIIPVIW